jgi:hypothetical protein
MHFLHSIAADQWLDVADATVVGVARSDRLARGDFVAVLRMTWELPSYLWCADASILPPHEPVRVSLLPEPGGVPLKVKAVCLPFVLVETHAGQAETLDVRRCQLARLDQGYAEEAWKALRSKKSKE